MGAFNLGAFGAQPAGALADRYRGYRGIAVARAALCAVSLWLFPLASSGVQLLLALADGAGFAGAVTIANLLIVERRPKSEWNQRLGWLETALSVGQDGALLLAAWLTGLGARSGLLIAALVPAAAIGLAVVLILPVPGRAVSTQNELVTSWPMPAASGNGPGEPVAGSAPAPAAPPAGRAAAATVMRTSPAAAPAGAATRPMSRRRCRGAARRWLSWRLARSAPGRRRALSGSAGR